MGTNKMDKKAGEKIEYFMDCDGLAVERIPWALWKMNVCTPNLDRLAAKGWCSERRRFPKPCLCAQQGKLSARRYPRTCGPRQNEDIDARERLFPKCWLTGDITADWPGSCICLPAIRIRKDWKNRGLMTDIMCSDGHTTRSPIMAQNWPSNAYNQFLLQNGRDYITPDREDCPYVQTGVEEKWHQTAWCADEAIAFMETARTYGNDQCFPAIALIRIIP